MSNTMHAVSVYKWAKWTGDNLAEIEEFWAAELAATNTTLTVDPDSGDLIMGWALQPTSPQCPVGYWAAPHSGVTTEEAITSNFTAIPATGLMPEVP